MRQELLGAVVIQRAGLRLPARTGLDPAWTLLCSVAKWFGAGLFSLAFAWAIRPELGLNLPGTPFRLAALLLLAARAIAWKATPPA